MALSDIAVAVPQSTIASTLALRESDPAAFRTAAANFLQTRFPNVTVAQAAAALASGKIISLTHANGYVGFGRGVGDALAAIRAKAPTP